MKKNKFQIIVVFLVISLVWGINDRKMVAGASGSVWIPAVNSAVEAEPQFEITQLSENSLQIDLQFSGIWAKSVSNEYGDYTVLFLEGYGEGGQFGVPDLPSFMAQVEIPQGVVPLITLVNYTSTTVRLSDYSLPERIFPIQPLPSKSGPAPQWQPPDAEIYALDQFYPQQLWAETSAYQMRDHHILPLQVYPVRYHPQNAALEVLEHLTIRIDWEEVAVANRPNRNIASAAFDGLVKDLVINPQITDIGTKDQTEIGYLIIAPEEFNTILSPLISLKTNQGYLVTLANLETIGTSTNLIQAYIRNAYDSWTVPPTYLLLVGDTNYIPAWYPTETPSCVAGEYCFDKATDLYYSRMTPDFVPDIFVGRLPARSQTQLTLLVNKLLAYENSSGFEVWGSKASFAATRDTNPNDSPDYDYNYELAEATHNYVISTYTAPLGYSGIFPAPAPVLGGDKLYAITYEAFETDLKNSLNDGRGMVVYSGHGSRTGWSDFSLYTNDFSDGTITANQIYPFVAGFACETNDITYEQTFGETWMLSEGKGAVAYLGSADYSYWEPDDILERNLFGKLFENTSEKASLAESVFEGLNAVQSQYPEFARYYWETYMLLGDPSLKVKMPKFSLSLDSQTFDICVEGPAQSYTLTTNAFFGFDENILLSSSTLPNGVTLTFGDNPVLPGDTTSVTISAGSLAQVSQETLTLSGASSSSSANTTATLLVSDQHPLSPLQISPKNKTIDSLFPTLNWEAVDQSSEYQLQIATDAGFTQLVTEINGISHTTYTLPFALESSTTYYWRVRAKNACGTSTYLSAAQFRTPVVLGDCSFTYAPNTEYQTDFETVSSDWTNQSELNTNVWQRQDVRAQSPTHAFFTSSAENASLQHLESPSFDIPADAVNPTLRFWQWYDLQKTSAIATCDDGGLIQYTTDDGATWSFFTEEQLLTTPYVGEVVGTANPLLTQQVWCGQSNGWVKTVVDLSAFKGETIKIRFSQGTDTSIAGEGWYIDDVKVQTCTALDVVYLPLISD